MKGLNYRYDVPLTKLGKNIEDVLPGEITFKNEEEVIPIITLNNTILDVFEVFSPSHDITTLYFNNKRSLEIAEDFFSFIEDLHCYDFRVKGKEYKGRNIQKLKYNFQNKIINIKIFCPIRFEEVKSFKDNWFKDLENGRSRRRRRS